MKSGPPVYSNSIKCAYSTVLKYNLTRCTLSARWEVERECLPSKATNRWRPHTRLHSPWGIVYICMGLASWLVWRQGGFAAHPVPLALYAALLVAVWLTWPATFIRGRQMSAAFDALGMLQLLPLDTSLIATHAQVSQPACYKRSLCLEKLALLTHA